MASSVKASTDFVENLIGTAEELNECQLPTLGDVLRACSMKRKDLKSGSLEPKWNEIRNFVSKKIMNIWVKASLPHKSEKRVRSTLDFHHNHLVKLRKAPRSHKKKQNIRRSESKFIGAM